jgi:hypothetical protein
VICHREDAIDVAALTDRRGMNGEHWSMDFFSSLPPDMLRDLVSLRQRELSGQLRRPAIDRGRNSRPPSGTDRRPAGRTAWLRRDFRPWPRSR